MRSFITLAGLCGVASAIGNYTVEATSLTTAEKGTMCNAQLNTCRTLCEAGGNGPRSDDCDTITLVVDCICNNGTAPGLEFYKESMVYSLCQKSFELCIADTVGNSIEQAECKSEIQDSCPTLDPANARASESNEEVTTTLGGDSSTETGSSPESTETTPDSGAVPTNMHHYGKAAGVVAIGLLAYML